MSEKEPREHGIIFGRGDELGDDVEEPPMAQGKAQFFVPGYSPAPMPFSTPPEEDVELTGDIPWELQDEASTPPQAKPETGPIIH